MINDISKSESIENLIYEIRGKQVMLDSDLARLYGCKNGTKTINLAVKRHINRFPDRFMFRLTDEEIENNCLRFQFETLNSKGNKRGQHIKYYPYAFTEQGIAMLATVIKTKIAEKVSIRIMDAFVSMKKYISNNLIEQKYINSLVLEDHDKIKILEETFDKLNKNNKINTIFYNGQIYDAYSKILDIFKLAINSLIIIDSYADNKVLDMFSKLNCNIILITKDSNRLNELDIDKYNSQYNNLKVIRNNTFHDRYIIIDEKEIYHLGASINNAGNKTFSINKLEDKIVIDSLLNTIINIINNSTK